MDLKTLLKAQWDRSTAVGCTILGALLLLVGWIGVSGTPFLAEQAPYILSGGVGGVFLLGVGATLWISADLRDEWRKLDRIETALLDGTLRFVENEPAEELPMQRNESDSGSGSVLEEEPVVSRPRRALRDTADTAPARRPVRAARTTTQRVATPTASARPRSTSRAGVGHA